MSEIEPVPAFLSLSMNVTCPNCSDPIDLLNEENTNGYDHDEGWFLLNQMLSKDADFRGFECKDVVCTNCKEPFNVRGLEW